jgi:diguanylate cyclase (GGDEF)-like protein
MLKIQKYQDVLFTTLLDITSLTIGGMDKRAIFEKLIDGCLVSLEAERVYLLEIEDKNITRYSKSRAQHPGQSVVTTISETPGIKEWLLTEIQGGGQLNRGYELAFDLPSLANRCLDSTDAQGAILSAPLVGKKSFFGLLMALAESGSGPYPREAEQLITVLANQAAIALENRQLYRKLEREAVTDGLTGVYNYRFLMATLEKEIQRARRFKQSFSFVMLDVDNLKQYNDNRGHLYGSQALKEIAVILKRSCRQIDFVSKYGGDEFGIILPQTDLRGAVKVTRRAIAAVADHIFEKNTPGLLTCSAGIALFPRDGKSVREVIASADKALYLAKSRGKNMVLTIDDMDDDERT